MKKIALIDDDVGVLQALKLLIGVFGVEVTTWSDPTSARTELIEHGMLSGFDAVISDLRMPKMDGIHLLSEILKSNPLMPCGIISGHASIEDIEKAKLVGIKTVIRKPCGVEEIRKTLSELGIL